jgi:isopenicillin-N N-acyltransferase like protein
METNELRVVECSGTPYEVGRQYGENRASSIRKASELFFGALIRSPFKVDKDEVKATARRAFLNTTRSFDPGSLDMVEGLAEGAGVDFDEAFALQCSIEVSLNYQHVRAMCTSFAVTGEGTQDGTTILGQNCDWHPDAPVDLLRIRHEDGLERFSLCLSGNAYYHLTSAGMGNCANLTLGPLRAPVSKVPLSFYLSKAMRQETIEGALSVLRPTARGFGYYHVADAKGAMFGIESVADDHRVIRPQKDMLVHANHYETEKFKEGDWAPLVLPCTHARGTRLRELIAGHYGEITPKLMMESLADHEDHPNSICRHVDEAKPEELASETRASVVMIPAQRTMYVSHGPPCQNAFVKYVL